jgi:hypothetical protein
MAPRRVLERSFFEGNILRLGFMRLTIDENFI